MDGMASLIQLAKELDTFINSGQKLLVAFLGPFNAGKSTVINYLLGEQASPVEIIPSTKNLIYFDYGSKFRAVCHSRTKKWEFSSIGELHAFLNSKNSSKLNINVFIPSPILQKCRLLDTPGLDFSGQSVEPLLKKAATEAGKIIFLLHQRGVDDNCRLFLQKLLALRKKKDPSEIIFLLCGQDRCDSHAFAAARETLKEIMPGDVRLYAFCATKEDNISALRVFLEVEAALFLIRSAPAELKKKDIELAEKIKMLEHIPGDAEFISEFWRLKDIANNILKANQLAFYPSKALSEVSSLLHHISSGNLGLNLLQPAGRYFLTGTGQFKEIRNSLLNMVMELEEINKITSIINPNTLYELRRRIEEERPTVAVAGGFSTGKSTFINALVKEEVLPVAGGPTTFIFTKIHHGEPKRAVVHTPLQIELETYYHRGTKTVLCYQEIVLLENWLERKKSAISRIEVLTNGMYRDVGRRELAEIFNRLKEEFVESAYLPVPAASSTARFRELPQKLVKSKGLAGKVRVTLHNRSVHEFDLTQPKGLSSFHKYLGEENTFSVEMAEVWHPSPTLKMAVFIDTPGLDYHHKNHGARIAEIVQNSDACLFFLNARHILNDADVDCLRFFAQFSMGEKTVFAINFTDTLNSLQKEIVYNYASKYLLELGITCPKSGFCPPLYMISSQQGFCGNGGGLEVLLAGLKERLSALKYKSFYLGRTRELYSLLKETAGKIKSTCETYDQPNDRNCPRSQLLEVRKTIRRHFMQLKEIKSTIYSIWRC